MLTVITFLWNDPERPQTGHEYQFKAEHVEVLRSMVRRNLTIPHQFVCITDEAVPGIMNAPMVWDKHIPGTVFARLQMRSESFARYVMGGAGCELPTRFLSLDIDMVVTGNIDHLITPEDRFWKNPNWPAPKRAYYQSSVQLFRPGAWTELYDEFEVGVTERWCRQRFGGAEQAWISERLPWNLPQWTEKDGIYGAGRLGDWGNTLQASLPDNACLVSFPGNRVPWDKVSMQKHPWVKEHYRN